MARSANLTARSAVLYRVRFGRVTRRSSHPFSVESQNDQLYPAHEASSEIHVHPGSQLSDAQTTRQGLLKTG